MVWPVIDIEELELSFFFNNIFHENGQNGHNMSSKISTFCVDISFLYILTFNAKCCTLLTRLFSWLGL